MSSIDLSRTSVNKLEQYTSSIENKFFKMLEIFNEISSIINRGYEFEQVLTAVLEKVLVLTGMEMGGIYLKEKKTGDYRLTVHSNVSERFLQMHGRITRDWKFFLPVMDEGKVVVVSDAFVLIPDARPERQKSVIEEGLRSFVGIPLINDNSIDGILMVSSSEPREFSEMYIKLFSIIGRQVGSSIRNANLIEQLKKSHDAYYKLFNNAKDVIYTHDLDGNFLSINQAGLDLLGYTREEILRSNIRDLLTEESLETASLLNKQVIQGNNIPLQPVLEVIRKDGKSLFLELNIWPIIEGGKPVGIHGIARDVDKRLHAEKNLLIFTKAINLASDGINISDADYRITFVNEAGAKIFGYSRSELIGQPADIFYAEEDLSNLHENVIPSMEKYGYWNGLILGRKKDGTAFPVEITLSSVMDENGKPLVNIGVFRERKSKKSGTSYHMKF